MAKQGRQRAYPPEFRRRLVELFRSGRNLSELSREFDVSRQAIALWIKQEDLDTGKRDDGLTTSERQELGRLRRENKRLNTETEILKKAAAWFARETNTIPERHSDS
jgi:transposase